METSSSLEKTSDEKNKNKKNKENNKDSIDKKEDNSTRIRVHKRDKAK